MNPIVHAELGWLIAQGLSARRDRVLTTLAGVAPDLDGLSILAGNDAYGTYHHLVFHGWVGALTTSVCCAVFARSRKTTTLMALAAFHLHLLCDLAGSGRDWPIYYWWPASLTTWSWTHGWELVSWQNTVIGLVTTLLCLACALVWQRTPVEIFSPTQDLLVVATIRSRFRRRGVVDGRSSDD